MKILQYIASKMGMAIIPLRELKRMERDAASDYACAAGKKDEWDRGYFNGLADAIAKKNHQLVERYVPQSSWWKCRAPFQKP